MGLGDAKDEVWLPEIGVDKVCPTLFSAETLDLAPVLFLMLEDIGRADCMCMAPHSPRDELWTFSLWVLLRNLSQSELCPLGSDREGQGWTQCVGLWDHFMPLPGLVNSASSFPCVLPRQCVPCVRCSLGPSAGSPSRNSTPGCCWLCCVISTG